MRLGNVVTGSDFRGRSRGARVELVAYTKEGTALQPISRRCGIFAEEEGLSRRECRARYGESDTHPGLVTYWRTATAVALGPSSFCFCLIGAVVSPSLSLSRMSCLYCDSTVVTMYPFRGYESFNPYNHNNFLPLLARCPHHRSQLNV